MKANRGRRPTRLVRSLRNGQVTIPAEFRRQLGIGEDSVLQVTLSQGELRIRPVRIPDTDTGSPWLKALYDQFAPVREEAAAFSSDEIDAAIDEAVKSVRRGNG